MQIEVNGTRLWFDVEGSSLVPDGSRMIERPTVVLVHGGPGTYDHSYFKPDFTRLSRDAQVVYVDLRDHGRSARHPASDWSFEQCADDLGAFCHALGLVRPVILGHSLGGFIAMLHGARHPDQAGGLILLSTMARFDIGRLVEGFRRVAGDATAELAARDYGGAPVTDDQWARIFAAFGRRVPDADQLARRVKNLEIAARGMDLLRRLDLIDQLARITCPTLVCAGDLDPVTPVDAAREIARALRPGVGRLAVIEGAGHFTWLDQPERTWTILGEFIAGCFGAAGPSLSDGAGAG